MNAAHARIETAKMPLPPGRTGWPLVGETLPFLKNAFGFVDERVAEFGPIFRTHILGHDTAVISGPLASQAFIDENLCVRDGATPRHVRELLGGRSLGVIDGKEHKDRKKQVLAGFQREALGSYLPAMQENVEHYLARWLHSPEVEGIEELKRLSLATIARNVTSLPTGPELEALFADFKLVTAGFMGLPIPAPGTAYTRAMAARNRIMARLGETVRAHRAGAYQDGLTRILAARADDGSALSDADVVMELHHINIAGYIIFAEFARILVELAEDPTLRARLVAEVKSASPEGPLRPDALRAMPQLDRFVKEVKRVVPVVPTLFARAKREFEVMGHRIPEGWTVFWAVRASNHHSPTFHEPFRFDPDRFAPERAEDTRHPEAYAPQGPGPAMGHKCPGFDYATLFMQVFTVVLLRGATWKLPEQDLGMIWERIPPEPRGGLRVRFARV
ncbi:MAG TPA: cytochrome P450 [Polyangiaceae bacterium]|jgi:cytochrome P450